MCLKIHLKEWKSIQKYSFPQISVFPWRKGSPWLPCFKLSPELTIITMPKPQDSRPSKLSLVALPQGKLMVTFLVSSLPVQSLRSAGDKWSLFQNYSSQKGKFHGGWFWAVWTRVTPKLVPSEMKSQRPYKLSRVEWMMAPLCSEIKYTLMSLGKSKNFKNT